MQSEVPVLQGVRVTLRHPSPDDVSARFAIGRHREIIEAYGGTFDARSSFTLDGARAAISFIENQTHAWVIDAGGFIGHIRFHSFAPSDKRANLAIGIDDPTRLGQGYGTEAIKLALRYIFDSGLHRISLRVLATNARAIRCYQKCGFVEEGREREAALIGGAWQDDVIMGILDRDFVALTNS